MNDESVRIRLNGTKILKTLCLTYGLLWFGTTILLLAQTVRSPIYWLSVTVFAVYFVMMIVLIFFAYRSMVLMPFAVSSEGITWRSGWNQSESLVSWEEMNEEDIGATPPTSFNPFWYVYRKNRYGEKRPVAQFPPLDWIENLDDVKPLLENAPKNRLTDAILK